MWLKEKPFDSRKGSVLYLDADPGAAFTCLYVKTTYSYVWYTHRTMKPLPYLLTEPPEELMKARLDNIALVPASLLHLRSTYQPIANTLPKGSILLVETASPRQKRILEKVASFLRTHSRQVITLPIERIKQTTHQRTPRSVETLQLAL